MSHRTDQGFQIDNEEEREERSSDGGSLLAPAVLAVMGLTAVGIALALLLYDSHQEVGRLRRALQLEDYHHNEFRRLANSEIEHLSRRLNQLEREKKGGAD